MQEEMFIIDLEREREKRDKTGRTMMVKMVSQMIVLTLVSQYTLNFFTITGVT